MLKNKGQIARDGIKTTLEPSRALKRALDPTQSEFGSALVMCMRAHNLLRPPPPNENPDSAPESCQKSWIGKILYGLLW